MNNVRITSFIGKDNVLRSLCCFLGFVPCGRCNHQAASVIKGGRYNNFVDCRWCKTVHPIIKDTK